MKMEIENTKLTLENTGLSQEHTILKDTAQTATNKKPTLAQVAQEKSQT